MTLITFDDDYSNAIDDWYGTRALNESIYLWQYDMDRGRSIRSLSTLPLLSIIVSYLSTTCSSSSNWWSDGRSVSSSVRRHSSLESFERDGHHGETRINHQSGAWRGSSRDELFATSSTHRRTVHFFFASAVMNVMLTMISLLVKDVVLIEKEERELIATPVVATLIIPHIINHSSSSSCSCCRVP